MEENKKGSCLKNIHFLDIQAKRFHLNLFGQEYYSTLVGSILSILSILIIISISIYIYANLFIDNYLFYGLEIENPQALVNLTGKPIMLALTNTSDYIIPSEKYDIQVSFLSTEPELDPLTANRNKRINHTLYKLEKCNKKKHFVEYPDIIPSFSLESFLCLTLDQNMSIYGKKGFGDYKNSQISIKLSRCKNESCVSTEYSTDSQLILKMAYLSYVVNYKNNTFSYNHKLELHNIPFSSNLVKYYEYYIQPILLEIDYGYIMSNTKQEIFYSYHHFESQVEINSQSQTSLLGVVNFNCTTQVLYYKKIYRKTVDFVTHVVSHINLILLILKLLTYFLTRKFMSIDIINEYFNKVNLNHHSNKVSQDPNHSEIKLNSSNLNINNMRIFRANTLKKSNLK
jgi:hypothetical protein